MCDQRYVRRLIITLFMAFLMTFLLALSPLAWSVETCLYKFCDVCVASCSAGGECGFDSTSTLAGYMRELPVEEHARICKEAREKGGGEICTELADACEKDMCTICREKAGALRDRWNQLVQALWEPQPVSALVKELWEQRRGLLESWERLHGVCMESPGCPISGNIAEPELTPMPEPKRKIGYKWVGLKNGAPHWRILVSKTSATRSWSTSEGCSYTSSGAGFSIGDPWLKWSGCDPWADGTQTFIRDAEIWPLKVGKQWKYRISGSNVRGDNWRGDRSCKIIGTMRIPTRIGVHDTYKIACEDPWSIETYYISPALKSLVYYEWSDRTRGISMTFSYTGE